jgi:hypothetical protein
MKNMKFKTKLLIGLPISFIIGGIFAFIMLYVFFLDTPIIKQIIIFTVGLPMFLSMTIASLPFIRQLLCESNYVSTFGCWGSNSLWISVVIYGILFAFIYYLLAKRKKLNINL